MLLGKAQELECKPFIVKQLNPRGVEYELELFAQFYWLKARGEFAFHGNCINFGRGTELEFLQTVLHL